MTDLQQAAEIYWRLINEQPVSRDDYVFCIKVVWGEHKGSPFYSLTSDLPEVIVSPISDQPKLAAVTDHWKKYLSTPAQLSDQQAIHFITELYAALENVEPHIKKRIAPGVTRCERNTVSDFVTRRPNVKLGWTIQLTTEGQGHYNCIRNQLVTQPGDLILLSPDALYDYYRYEDNEVWQHHWAYFLLQDDWLDLLQWPEVGPNIYHLGCEGDTFKRIQALFDDLVDSRFDNHPLSERLSGNVLEQILIRCQELAPESTSPKVDRRIIQAKEYITANYNKSFSVAALAKDIGLSVARLSSLFKKHTGTTIVRWRDEHRMTRAAQLLSQTDQPVSRIADIVGYNDALYFSRCFHQQTGCSPVEYRNKKKLSHLPEDKEKDTSNETQEV